MNEIDRREQKRIKQALLNQQPHRKEERRQASKMRSRAHKVKTTEKRFTEHTMEELLSIAQKKYNEAGLDWNSKKSDVTEMLTVLHRAPIVLSEVHTQSNGEESEMVKK